LLALHFLAMYSSMPPLPPPDSFHVDAAAGWFMLGNLTEAALELERLSPAARDHPDALDLRWIVCARRELWEQCLQVAQTLLTVAPDRPDGWLHQAYSLRRVAGGGLAQAWAALLPAADRFPDEVLVPFNLACYACQLGDLDAARTWIERAWAIAEPRGQKNAWIRRALADADLEPLWPELRRRQSPPEPEPPKTD
jgi:tetratricopeptide (TPR) repeat protein